MTTPQSRDIAIIGMDCLFPGAPDIQTYWANIVQSRDCITAAPKSWDGDKYLDEKSREYNRIYTTRGGFIDDLVAFNPFEFGIMPNVIEGSDPEHYLVLRLAKNALDDAGYGEKAFNRERTGVILGRAVIANRGNVTIFNQGLVIDQTLNLIKQLMPSSSPKELDEIESDLKNSIPRITAENVVGTVPNLASSRIANRLDLMGTNFNVDCACASSLIALDAAISELLRNRCDMMLVGGIQTTVPPPIFMVFCQLQALSRRTSLRPFDKNADGTMLGEGLGMLVLKRREDAERDGDRIYAVIKEVGVASDGKGRGILAPRPEGEALAVRRAYEASGISPLTVDLVEAHGTGTNVGDPIEMNTVKEIFSAPHETVPRCAVGSVKSMIAHTLTAAGIAGVIKCALSLYYKILPPTLCDEPDPALGLDNTAVYINTATRPWVHGGIQPRRAGVNSFGFGGINSHALLEEAAGAAEYRDADFHLREDEVLVVGAGEKESLVGRLKGIKDFIQSNPSVTILDLANALALAYAPDLPFRIALVVKDQNDLVEKIDRASKKLMAPDGRQIMDQRGIYYTETPMASQGKLAVLFPGEGSQYKNMMLDLCKSFPRVRERFDLADRINVELGQSPLPSQVAYPPIHASKEFHFMTDKAIWRMDYAIPLVRAANQAMFGLLTDLGIEPDCLAGHSIGDDSALFATGILKAGSLAEQVAYQKESTRINNQAMTLIPRAKLMTVGATSPETVSEALKAAGGRILVSMDNCRNQVVLCGSEEDMSRAFDFFASKGGVCSYMEFDRGYHTPAYEPVCEEFRKVNHLLDVHAPRIPVYSCMIAGQYPNDPEKIRKIMVDQWAKPVRFRETIEKMYQDGVRIFVESGARGNLTHFVADILNDRPHLAVAGNDFRRSGTSAIHHLVAQLIVNGVSLNLPVLFEGRGAKQIDFGYLGEKKPAQPAQKEKNREQLLNLSLPYLSLKKQHQISASAGKARSGSIASARDLWKGNTHRDIVVQQYMANMDQFLSMQEKLILECRKKAR